MQRRSALLILCALAAGGALAGCGQKGPLYLPTEEEKEERKKEKTSRRGERRSRA
ncbi:MAG: lipoprotein [Gammaproteobacteria bacterium]|nr:lipoprotein [Gammaproteobacteria bacterium]